MLSLNPNLTQYAFGHRIFEVISQAQVNKHHIMFNVVMIYGISFGDASFATFCPAVSRPPYFVRRHFVPWALLPTRSRLVFPSSMSHRPQNFFDWCVVFKEEKK